MRRIATPLLWSLGTASESTGGTISQVAVHHHLTDSRQQSHRRDHKQQQQQQQHHNHHAVGHRVDSVLQRRSNGEVAVSLKKVYARARRHKLLPMESSYQAPARLPLVVTMFIPLDPNSTKHGYKLNKTVQIPAPYVVFCGGGACNTIASARANSQQWSTTTIRGNWSVERATTTLARAANVAPARLRKALERSVVKGGGSNQQKHCCCADLLLLWLLKPVLVQISMRDFPEYADLAWVDSGLARYQKLRYVPPPPWAYEIWPTEGKMAVQLVSGETMKTPKLLNRVRNTSRANYIVGSHMYGSRVAWSRFVDLFLRRLRHLVETQDEWAGRGLHMLCDDQALFTDVACAEPQNFEVLTAENSSVVSWGWHVADHLVPFDGSSTVRRQATAQPAAGRAPQPTHPTPPLCTSTPPSKLAVVALLASSSVGSLQTYSQGLLVLGQSLTDHAPGIPRYLMVTTQPTPQVRGWTSCHSAEITYRTPVARWQHTFRKFAIFSFAQFQRVLFLDADTLVVSSLDKLWRWPIPDGTPLAAVEDMQKVNSLPFWHANTTWEPAPWFNSGVMLLRPNTSFYNHLLRAISSRRLPFFVDGVSHVGGPVKGDQDILNGVIGPNWVRLPPSFNGNLALHRMQSRWDAALPMRILHFTLYKPWASCNRRVRALCVLWRKVRSGIPSPRSLLVS